MKISELQPGQGSVNVEATVKSVEPTRTINKYGRDLRLANAIITDGESEIKLTLWNEDVAKVSPGTIIKIQNGYVSEFQGEKQLTTGKFGKLEVVGGKEKNNKSAEKESDESSEIKEEVIEDY